MIFVNNILTTVDLTLREILARFRLRTVVAFKVWKLRFTIYLNANDNETIESKLNEIKNDNATCTIKHGRNSDSVCTLRSFFRLC